MTARRTARGPVGIRRRGRHSTPSQVEKVALQAGKAAPAVAIAGAVVMSPQALPALAAQPAAATATAHQATAGRQAAGPGATAATLDSFQTRTVAVTAASTARHAAAARSTVYRVRSGDSLSQIASRHYHNAAAWQYLYHENAKEISDPDLIYPGETLMLPASVPAHFTLTNYVPRHAKPVTAAPVAAQPASHRSSGHSRGGSAAIAGPARGSTIGGGRSSSGGGSSAGSGSVVVQAAAQGQYSCSGLEQIWEQAGGSPSHAFMAAEIAMAESGGNPNAISPTDDFGLWQINASNGALATLNPFQNARSAVVMSDDGTNWGPWTTYTSGAYSGRC